MFLIMDPYYYNIIQFDSEYHISVKMYSNKYEVFRWA
jgi:hypothetical protein